MAKNPECARLVRAAMQSNPRRGIAGVAAQLGISRSKLSRYLNEPNYPPAAVEAAILSRLDRRDCPHLQTEITPDYCRSKALTPKPFGGRTRQAHWLACQTCPNKPVQEVTK